MGSHPKHVSICYISFFSPNQFSQHKHIIFSKLIVLFVGILSCNYTLYLDYCQTTIHVADKTQVLCSTWLPFAFQIERISYQFCGHSADILRFYQFLRRVLNWTPLKLNTTQWHRANKTYYIPSRSIFKARISIFNFFSGCVWVKSTVPRWQFVFKCSFVDRLREWHSPPTAGKT